MILIFELIRYIALRVLVLTIFINFGNFFVLFLFLGTAKKKKLKNVSSKKENALGKIISKIKLKSKKKKKKTNKLKRNIIIILQNKNNDKTLKIKISKYPRYI